MEKTISILHISDTHRNQEGKVDNTALITSLIQDKENYTKNDKIKEPDLIIVSGDIIYGSSKSDFDTAVKEINEQYEEAEIFLNELVDIFLGGDKSKIIIIPGNHDVSFPHVQNSIKEIDISKTNDTSIYTKKLFSENSNVRWSWKNLKYYEIANHSTYKYRLEPFKIFYDRFYSGLQEFSIEPEKQYNIFDCPSIGLTIVAYNSCFNNDLLNPTGSINPNCIAGSYRDIIEYTKKGRFIIGTWHHNVKGAPRESNYMDIRTLKNIMRNGITLGFHGHQHQLEKIDEFMDVSENEKITLISAGSLCAGPNHLPTGFNRQYNILEIEAETFRAKLHSRKMMENINFSLPIWEKDNISGCEKGYMELQLKKPEAPNIDLLLSEVIDLIGNKDYPEAIDLLKSLPTIEEQTKSLLLECYIQTSNNPKVIETIGNPNTEKETIILLQTLFRERERQRIKEVLELSYVQSLNTPIVVELKNKCKAIV
ncbi:metallophosphoesterase family protein [Carboxylicivirga taeanensis]|uniref:metallophosphoesterase family protein n=1 Tax=Carboxylicivirga taeanensis TaxID=1416875 RepID=UPI003F6DCF93